MATQKTEAMLACSIMNTMTGLGMPDGYCFSLQRQNTVGLMDRGVSDDDVGRDFWQRQRLGDPSPSPYS